MENKVAYELPFIDAYLPMRNLAYIASKAERDTILHMAFIMNKAGSKEDENIIRLTPQIKNQLMEDTGLSWNTIKNALCYLAKKGAITKEDSGAYQVNPFLFSKGKNDDILEIQLKWLRKYGNLGLNKCPELWRNLR